MEILEFLIRVRGGAKAAAEAEVARKALNDLTQDAQGKWRNRLGQFATDAEKAAAGVENLGNKSESAAKQLKGLVGGGSGGIFGAGRIGSMAQAALVAAPAIVGLSGSIIALAGSAAAAAGGAGAIGIGGIGALTVGLSGLVAVAAPVVSGLKDIKTAQDAYNLAVKQYGYWSKQAGTASQHLQAVIAVSGGEPVARIARSWTALTQAFRENTAAARHSLIGAIGSGFGAAHRLLPAFSAATNQGVGAVSRGLRGAFGQLSGPGVQGMIGSLGGIFANVSTSLIRAGTDLFIAIGRVAVAAGPYVEMVGRGVARWAHALRGATSDGSRLGGIVGTLVGHLRSWWDLAKAVGRVFFILLGTGAKSGKGLVDSLTGVVTAFGDWLQKMRDTGKLQKFFSDSARLTRQLFGAARDLLVPMLRLARVALPPFVGMLRWLRPVLPELVGLFIGWRVATRLLNSAFQVAATIGRWRKLAATLRTLPWASTGRRGGRLFGRAFGIAAAAGISIEIGRKLVDLTDKLHLFGGKPGRLKRQRWVDKHIPGMKELRDLGKSLGLEQMAAGGLVRSRGAAIVGDKGPEILDLPQGARVSPLGAGGFGGDIVLRVSGREIARVSNREIQAQMARGA